MQENEKKQKTLLKLIEKLSLHYKRHGYYKRKKRKTNPMWGIDPKRIKETD